MSEEIRNEEGLSPEMEVAASAEVSQDGSSEGSESAVEEAVQEDASAPEAVEEAVQEVAEDAADSAEQAVDLSHMSWEDRVSYYLSLESVEGYVEAIRLADFHNPGDVQVAETWGMALNAHPEMAVDIFLAASRLISSEQEVWSNIIEAHAVALESASDEGQIAISESAGLIQCLRGVDLEEGKARLVILKMRLPSAS